MQRGGGRGKQTLVTFWFRKKKIRSASLVVSMNNLEAARVMSIVDDTLDELRYAQHLPNDHRANATRARTFFNFFCPQSASARPAHLPNRPQEKSGEINYSVVMRSGVGPTRTLHCEEGKPTCHHALISLFGFSFRATLLFTFFQLSFTSPTPSLLSLPVTIRLMSLLTPSVLGHAEAGRTSIPFSIHLV